MRWLDPAECAAARDCLEKGNAREAAKLLLTSPNREHRAVRQLLLEISARLIEEAVQAFGRGEVQLAWEAIECARACATLPGEAAALRARLALQRHEDEKQRAWHDKRLRQAQGLADEGRLRSALGLLGKLTAEPAVHRLRLDCGERLARFERYLRECRVYLDQGEVAAACGRLARARTIMADDPEVERLAKLLPPEDPSETGVTASLPSRPINNRCRSFALADRALVVLAPEAVIGNPLDDTVHLPIQARIHRRHARLIRERGRYRVEPCSPRCEVRVNGRLVERSQRLHDGDRLALGNASCEWVFRLPVAKSLTAVLEAGPSAPSVWTPAGLDFRRVVLVDDALHIRSRGPAHLLWDDLPCDLLLFRWQGSSMVAEVEGGELIVEAGGEATEELAAAVFLPSRLTICCALDEAERLGRAFAGREVPDTLSLRIHDPYEAGASRSNP